MKKLSVILLFFIILSNLFSQQLELEKIDDFMIAQTYGQRDNVITEDGYLYTLSFYGLEIYEIGNNGELTSVSRLPITISNSIAKKDEFVYISSGNYSSANQYGKLYQINIEDKQNPIIVQDINFVYFTWPIEIYDDILRIHMYDVLTTDNMNQFYSLPDLSLIAQYENYLNNLEKLDDTTALRFDGYNQFTVFDLSNPASPEIIGSGDVSSQHQYNISRVSTHNDTILICSNIYLITFWDVSDWNNWEYVSQYSVSYNLFNDFKPLIIGTEMILVEYGYVELIDITDIHYPVQLFILPGTAGYVISAYIAAHDDNLYITTNYNGIQRLKLINNILTFVNEFAEYYFSSRTKQHDDFLITAHSQNSYKYFDLSNPADPIDLGEFLPTYNPFFEISNNRIAVFQEETFDYDVFDISNIHEPTISNQIEFNSYHICRFDNTDSNSIYFVENNSNHLKKYDISQVGVSELIFDEILPLNVYTWIIHNGYGYFIEYAGSFNRTLYIYEGLEINQPVLSCTIYNFVTNRDTRLKMIYGMLAVYTEFDIDIYPENGTRFYDISDPNMPLLTFELNTFGEPCIKDELIFTETGHYCYVFEKMENPTGILEPMYTFYDVNSINNISFIEHNNEDYLLLSQSSHTGVFNYEYTPSVAEDEISVPTFNLANHPNPFNPETKIAFNIPESGKVKVEIFNVKGQKVRQLVSGIRQLPEGQHSIIWDGTDENNQPVSTGVYLYQLEVDGKPVASRKMLMMK